MSTEKSGYTNISVQTFILENLWMVFVAQVENRPKRIIMPCNYCIIFREKLSSELDLSLVYFSS